MYCFFLFPNRVYSIGFSWSIKEEDTQKHTQIVTGNRRWPEKSAKALFKNRRVFPSKSLLCYCFIRSENFSLEKQTVFHFSLFLHKEITHNCFHYWRRREPPVLLICGENSSRILSKVKIYFLFYTERKFFTGKTNGFSLLSLFT